VERALSSQRRFWVAACGLIGRAIYNVTTRHGAALPVGGWHSKVRPRPVRIVSACMILGKEEYSFG
jgi:hypothetical protein